MSMRFPKGLRAVVEKYAGRIEAVTGAVDWENPLGCGSYGCVFPLVGRPDVVMKISSDATEGPVVSAIMKTGLDKKLDGLSRWYGVWRIPEPIQEGPRGTGWVILRESVKPFDYARDIGWGRVAPWTNNLRSYNEHSRKAIAAKTVRGRERHLEEAGHEIGGLYNDQGTYYVAEAIEELGREGIILADVHGGNLGFRIHPTEEQPLMEAFWNDQVERPSLLIFDPGHSEAPATEIKALYALAGAANPWMKSEADSVPEI